MTCQLLASVKRTGVLRGIRAHIWVTRPRVDQNGARRVDQDDGVVALRNDARNEGVAGAGNEVSEIALKDS